MTTEVPKTPHISPGRPTREQARLRQAQLLEIALDCFLEQGFEAATMERIATLAGMSKRTVYAYYGDKEALFRASVKGAIERYRMPREALDAIVAVDLGEALRAVGRLRLLNLSDPAAIKLQRVLTAQAHRFPELFEAAYMRAIGPTLAFLHELFAAAQARGEITLTEPDRAATAFLSLVIGGAARVLVAGAPLSQAEIEARIDYGVALFLNGARTR